MADKSAGVRAGPVAVTAISASAASCETSCGAIAEWAGGDWVSNTPPLPGSLQCAAAIFAASDGLSTRVTIGASSAGGALKAGQAIDAKPEHWHPEGLKQFHGAAAIDDRLWSGAHHTHLLAGEFAEVC